MLLNNSSSSQSVDNGLGSIGNGGVVTPQCTGTIPEQKLSYRLEERGDLGIRILSLFDQESRNFIHGMNGDKQMRRWTMTFPESDLFAIGIDSERFALHTHVHSGVTNLINKEPRIVGNTSSLDSFYERTVAGFKEGDNLIVRIEDHTELIGKLSNKDDPNYPRYRKELDGLVDFYRRAIDINVKSIHESGGEIVLLPLGEDSEARLVIPKMLGRLHQVTTAYKASDTLQYIEKCTQKTHVGKVYYHEFQKIRYLSPDRIAGLANQLDNKDAFLFAINELQEWINPPPGTTKKVEARFLLVDPKTEKPMDHGSEEANFRSFFTDLVDSANNYKDNWENGKVRIKDEIETLVRLLKEVTHPSCQSDDLTNPEFVRILGNVLRSGGKGLEFGEGFSTPLKAVEIGYFQDYPDGTRDFIHSTSDGTHELILDWVINKATQVQESLKLADEIQVKGLSDSVIIPPAVDDLTANEFAELLESDWLCLCEPEIPLTFEHRPSNFVRAFGSFPEENFVVLFGKVGEPEHRIVVKGNPFASYVWEILGKDKVNELRGKFSDFELTKLVEFYQQWQNYLCQALTRISGVEHFREADKFQPIPRSEISEMAMPRYNDGDLLYRPFYGGERLDLVKLTEWNYDQIKGGINAMAEVFALNIIKQSPSLDFSSFIVSEKDSKTGVPLEILSLSTSETFSNSLRINDRDRFLRKNRVLQSAHAAIWIMSYINGPHGQQLSPQDRAHVIEELSEVVVEKLRKTLTTITQDKRDEFREELKVVSSAYNELRHQMRSLNKNIPGVLDLAKEFTSVNELLEMDENDIDDHCAAFKYAIHVRCKQLTEILDVSHEPNAEELMRNYELRENVIFAVYSLVNNHFSVAEKFATIDRILSSKEFDLKLFTPDEKIWLFNFIDVAAWLDEIRYPGALTHALLVAAEQQHNFDDFFHVVKEELPGLNLPVQLLHGFHEAIYGLLKFKNLSIDDPKRKNLRRTLLSVEEILGSLREFRSEV